MTKEATSGSELNRAMGLPPLYLIGYRGNGPEWDLTKTASR